MDLIRDEIDSRIGTSPRGFLSLAIESGRQPLSHQLLRVRFATDVDQGGEVLRVDILILGILGQNRREILQLVGKTPLLVEQFEIAPLQLMNFIGKPFGSRIAQRFRQPRIGSLIVATLSQPMNVLSLKMEIVGVALRQVFAEGIGLKDSPGGCEMLQTTLVMVFVTMEISGRPSVNRLQRRQQIEFLLSAQIRIAVEQQSLH